MRPITFIAMSSEEAGAYRDGRPDANGQAPERHVSDGGGNPCRCCLDDIAAGEDMLVFSYRPFATLQPYSEVGPVFLHARPCARQPESGVLPPTLSRRETVLVRGYDRDDRIVDGTGMAVATTALAEHCARTLDDPRVARVHVRSATNGCFQCRVEAVSRVP